MLQSWNAQKTKPLIHPEIGIKAMHHSLGILAIVAAIGFAFGERTARACVGAALVIGLLAFLYVFVRVAMGTV